jgi:hypothetical protein
VWGTAFQINKKHDVDCHLIRCSPFFVLDDNPHVNKSNVGVGLRIAFSRKKLIPN